MSPREQKKPWFDAPAGSALAALFVLFAIGPLIVAWLSSGTPAHRWRELGSGLGMTAAALLVLQFWSSGRFERITGQAGIDRTMGFHRVSAFVLLVCALLHPLFYLGLERHGDIGTAWQRLTAMLSVQHLRSGAIGLVLLVAMIGFAAVRTRAFIRYEVWRASHGIAASVAAVLVLHHAILVGSYSASNPIKTLWIAYGVAALAAIAIVYIYRPIMMWREDWQVEVVRPLAEGVVELTLKGPDTTQFSFRGGQFVWLTVAPNSPPFHDHPFSIASGPHELPSLRLIIRQAGDCTNTFGTIEPGRPVAIDGPHGGFTLNVGGNPVIMFAGGVGIAPILGVLEEAAERRDGREFRLLYAARNRHALAGREALARLSGRLNLKVAYCVDDHCPGFAEGPVCDRHVEELLAGVDPAVPTVLMCGPPPMMETVGDALLRIGVPGRNITWERFDYGGGRGRLDRKRLGTDLATLSLVAAAIAAFALR